MTDSPKECSKLADSAAMRAWVSGLAERLRRRRDEHLYRELTRIESASGPTVMVGGKEYLQFCSNNYLGLATDPAVIEAAREATAKYGAGSGASRLVAGSMDLHHQLEETLAEWKHAEAALVFPSGFVANLAVLTTFTGAVDRIVSDKLNHASLLDGAKFSGAECRVFAHRDYARAGELLTKPRRHDDTTTKKHETRNTKRETNAAAGTANFLVTDTVFSMDGDVADLRAACDVAERTSALVITDEAHASGVLGATGSGLAELQNETRVALSVGTLSKALGSIGGFVTGPRAAIETLINSARPFIYTTALPASASAAALKAIEITRRDPARRERVLKLAAQVKHELETLGFSCGDSVTPIIPVMMKDSETALRVAAYLRERGIWVPAIRPPTVKEARLRISLMTTHRDSQIESLLSAMRDLAGPQK